jgi:UDP-N-acetylmuramate dehydrogenase
MEKMSYYTNLTGKDITTMRAGGLIKKVYKPQSQLEFIELLKELDSNCLVIGNGSNILIKDEGYDGIIIINKIETIEIRDNLLWATSGTSMPNLCTEALNYGFTGFEFMCDIPGTVGGGIYMNASAWGGDISSILEEVTIFRDGRIEKLTKNDLQLSYRHSVLHNNKDVIILEAGFTIIDSDKSIIAQKINTNRLNRIKTQPLLSEYASSGSIFKKINMKELQKLQGYTIGGAQISNINPNFIVNFNNAKTKDILEIIKHIQKTTGGELEVEIF